MRMIGDIYQAIINRRMIAFHYKNNDLLKYREVIPYSLSLHNGLFYLMAQKRNSDYREPVLWRLDRMTDLSVTTLLKGPGKHIRRPIDITPCPKMGSFKVNRKRKLPHGQHLYEKTTICKLASGCFVWFSFYYSVEYFETAPIQGRKPRPLFQSH